MCTTAYLKFLLSLLVTPECYNVTYLISNETDDMYVEIQYTTAHCVAYITLYIAALLTVSPVDMSVCA